MINVTQLSCFALRVKGPQTSFSHMIFTLSYIYTYVYFVKKNQKTSKSAADLVWLQLITFPHAYFFLILLFYFVISVSLRASVPTPAEAPAHQRIQLTASRMCLEGYGTSCENCAPECYFCVCVLMFPSWVESLGSDSL